MRAEEGSCVFFLKQEGFKAGVPLPGGRGRPYLFDGDLRELLSLPSTASFTSENISGPEVSPTVFYAHGLSISLSFVPPSTIRLGCLFL